MPEHTSVCPGMHAALGLASASCRLSVGILAHVWSLNPPCKQGSKRHLKEAGDLSAGQAALHACTVERELEEELGRKGLESTKADGCPSHKMRRACPLMHQLCLGSRCCPPC